MAAKSTKKKRSRKRSPNPPLTLSSSAPREGKAPPHSDLADDFVHLFVDDQNLFWGIVNKEFGISFRIDFGKLATEMSKTEDGTQRPIKSAYIAGVIPDDDSFWQVAENQGFTVHRGYLGTGNRSKQDDAYLITEIMSTIYEMPGPSTIVLAAGDADYVPPLTKALEKGWRNEVAFLTHSVSTSLITYVHEFRQIDPQSIRYEGQGYAG